jgi:Tol biopolymer transport system component
LTSSPTSGGTRSRSATCPEIGNRVRASAFAKAGPDPEASDGTLHLAPALSPDGSQIAYFSEKDFYFVDLYLADANTGRVKRRILKSSFSPNYETFRFINSGVAWSPDGRYLALTAKKGPKDDLVIVDVARHHEVKRISIDLNGMTTPAWSPDGKQLVFTGYDGGISDLYVVNADGTGFRKLTNDRNADLHPVWSPDGKTIAFRDRPRAGDGFSGPHVQQYADRALPPGRRLDRDARPHGGRPQLEPPVLARRQDHRVRLRRKPGLEHLPV